MRGQALRDGRAGRGHRRRHDYRDGWTGTGRDGAGAGRARRRRALDRAGVVRQPDQRLRRPRPERGRTRRPTTWRGGALPLGIRRGALLPHRHDQQLREHGAQPGRHPPGVRAECTGTPRVGHVPHRRAVHLVRGRAARRAPARARPPAGPGRVPAGERPLGGGIGYVTLAPELPGAPAFVEQLAGRRDRRVARPPRRLG